MKYEEMRAPDLAALDRERTLAVIPIAAVEQHGPHLPTGTDRILCTAAAEALEAKLTAAILLTPTVWLGSSAHHLRLRSTLDCGLDAYIALLCEIGHSLLGDGFRRLLFLNGHGGNIDPMRVALRKLQPGHEDALLAAGSYWSVADETREATLEGDHQFVGHACEFETSLMLHLRPDLVEASKMADAGELITDSIDGVFLSRDMRHRTRDGYTGRPDLATAEKGQVLFEAIVEGWIHAAQKLLGEPLGSTYEDFV